MGFTRPVLCWVLLSVLFAQRLPAEGPQDCHVAPGAGYAATFFDFRREAFETHPSSPISWVLPPTMSSLTVFDVSETIQDLDCRVEITHTFIGDLDVTLADPSGATVVQLHNSAGSASDNIRAIFDDEGRDYNPPFADGDHMQPSGPGSLADFDGLDANGDWTLTVVDNFNGEDGTLEEWELLFLQRFVIPDADLAGIEALIEVDPSNTDAIGDLDIQLDVEHPFIGQLQIELTSPSGTTIVLHNLSGGATSGIHARYDDDPGLGGFNDGFGNAIPDGPGLLGDFDGEPVAGIWILHLIDLMGGEVGELQNFELLICPVECSSPREFACNSHCTSQDVTLTWMNEQSYAGIEVRRDGLIIATLPGDAEMYLDRAVPAGTYSYELVADCSPGLSSVSCPVVHAPYSGRQTSSLQGSL